MGALYCISGLGADERIFNKLDFKRSDVHFLNWIQPHPKEDINAYALRLGADIKHKDATLLGLSFGGMMAMEIARLFDIPRVVLISTVKERGEIPAWMKLCGKCHLESILPRKSLTSYPVTRVFRPIQNYFLGAKTEEEIRMANEYRDKVDPLYLKWSLNKIFNWNIDWQPKEFIHIHGNNDHIFPIRYVKPTHVIEGGGHFMVMNKHEQISKIINDFL